MGQRWDRVKAFFGFEIEAQGPTFIVDSAAIPAEVLGLTTYDDPINPAQRIARRQAIQVPAVKNGRDLIAGTIGQIPFRRVDGENVEQISPLLDQPERFVARSITMTRTVEDLLFEAISWWKVTERDFRGYPTFVERLPVRSVFQDEKGRTYVDRPGPTQTLPNGRAEYTTDRSRREYIADQDLIRFDSPTDPILVAGARAIRTYLKLTAAADRYADSPLPQGVFTPKPEADPDTDEVESFLDDWATARRTRVDAYIPAVVDYQQLSWDPAKLQLNEAREAAVIEIARVFNLDAEDLNVSTTSRTYANIQDRRLTKINDALGMYVSAIAERLSMGDVTPRGHRVVGDFNGFLRADDKTRLETYTLGVDLGLYDRNAIAEREGLPQPMFPAPAPRPAIEAPVQASKFDADPNFYGFDTEATRTTFAVDPEARTITGLAVPYGATAKRNGRTYSFSKGSLAWSDVGRVKLLIQHDRSQAVGRAVELIDTDAGLLAKFKIARTQKGDEALALAADGVYDGLSVGLSNDAQFSARDGIFHSAPGNALVEISLTPQPAFDDARVSAVVAEADTERKTDMTPEEIQALIDAGIAAHLAANPPAPAVTLEASGPEVIPSHGGATTFEVNEPAPYVFDRRGVLHAGAFDFSTDLFSGLRNRDQEALARVTEFMQHQFDVDTADVNEVNPSGQRPDLYVDEKKFTYPLWEAVRKGSLSDNTPFIIPKWSSSSGLVAAHVEATEPTPGTFVTTGQTITPSAVSGKVEITREVFDAGGNPNVSNLIWNKMVVAYYEGIEAAIQAMLVAANASFTNISLTAGGGTTGQTLHAELGAAIAALQFVRGGFTFDTFVAQIDLYKAIAGALDDSGRPLFPIYGPSNSNGTAAAKYKSLNVHGLECIPGTFLEPTGTDSEESWIFDRKDVFAAASPPQRLEFQSLVEQVELGIWGYIASAVTDATGVRDVYYDPVA